MLEHGAGKVLIGYPDDIIYLFVVDAFLCAVIVGFCYMRLARVKSLIAILVIGLFGGLFGYSTLVMALPPLLLLLMYGLNKSPFYSTKVL